MASSFVTINCVDHHQKLTEALWNSFLAKSSVDFNLTWGGRRVRAHRLLLDPFLSADKLLRAGAAVQQGQGDSCNMLELLLKFLYTGQLVVARERLGGLLALARDSDFGLLVDTLLDKRLISELAGSENSTKQEKDSGTTAKYPEVTVNNPEKGPWLKQQQQLVTATRRNKMSAVQVNNYNICPPSDPGRGPVPEVDEPKRAPAGPPQKRASNFDNPVLLICEPEVSIMCLDADGIKKEFPAEVSPVDEPEVEMGADSAENSVCSPGRRSGDYAAGQSCSDGTGSDHDELYEADDDQHERNSNPRFEVVPKLETTSDQSCEEEEDDYPDTDQYESELNPPSEHHLSGDVPYDYHPDVVRRTNVSIRRKTLDSSAATTASQPGHECPFCGMLFNRREDLNIHAASHAGQRPNQSFKRAKMSAQSSEQSNSTRTQMYACAACERSFSREDSLKFHRCAATKLESSVKGAKFSPGVAVAGQSQLRFSLNNRGQLEDARLDHARDSSNFEMVVAASLQLGELDDQSMVLLEEGESPQKLHQCGLCPKTFAQSSSLYRHNLTHSGKRKNLYVCADCPKAFGRADTLRDHRRVHTGEKPFQCKSCEKSFSQAGSLKLHVSRLHTDDKPYKCSVCPDRAFNQLSDLRRHLNIHTGERPYKCDVCPMTFCYPEDMRRHFRSHTGEKPYKCDLCQKTFTVARTLKIHMRSHARDQALLLDEVGGAASGSS